MQTLESVDMRKKALAAALATLFAVFSSSSAQTPIASPTPTPTLTPSVGNFVCGNSSRSCVGFQLDCSLELTDACSAFTEDDFDIFVLAGGVRSTTTFVTRRLLLNVPGPNVVTFTVHYTPIIPDTQIHVEISFNLSTASVSDGCSFQGSAYTTVVSCPDLHTLAVNSTWSQQYATVQGGDVLVAQLTLNATRLSLSNLVLAADLHPALTLINTNYSTGQTNFLDVSTTGVMQPQFPTQADIQNRSLSVLSIAQLAVGFPFYIDLTFQVEAYVLPNASITATFYIWYLDLEFEPRLNLRVINLDSLSTPVPTVGQPIINLVSYLDAVMDTLPPEMGDLFSVEIPLNLPCISTNIDLVVELPSFLNYTVEFTGEDGVNVTAPDGILCLPSLCDYTTPESQPSRCEQTGVPQLVFDVIAGSLPAGGTSGDGFTPLDFFPHSSGSGSILGSGTGEELELEPGVDNPRIITVRLPPLLYNTSEGTSDCSGANQTVVVRLQGIVSMGFTDSACGLEALSDYLQVRLTYSEEQSTSIFEAIQVVQANREDQFIVFAGVPYVDALITSSTNGTATDRFTVTFTVQHNPANSNLLPSSFFYVFRIDSPGLSFVNNVGILCTLDPATGRECRETIFFVNNTVVSGIIDR